MPPTALLILLLAGIVFLSARLYASPHSRGGGQVGGLTFEAEPVRRHQPIALVVTRRPMPPRGYAATRARG